MEEMAQIGQELGHALDQFGEIVFVGKIEGFFGDGKSSLPQLQNAGKGRNQALQRGIVDGIL